MPLAATDAAFACGFLLGVLFLKLLALLPGATRVCCREHLKTHATCECPDCVAERDTEEMLG